MPVFAVSSRKFQIVTS